MGLTDAEKARASEDEAFAQTMLDRHASRVASSANRPLPAGFDYDEFVKGLTEEEKQRGAEDLGFAQQLIDRHTARSAVAAKPRAPAFEIEDVVRGILPSEKSRAADDVGFAQTLVDRHARYVGDFNSGARAAFIQGTPTPDDIGFARWLQNTGRLNSDAGPGFWKTLGHVALSTAAGVPEVAGEAYRYRKAKIVGSTQEKADAETRSDALGAEMVNQVAGMYGALATGARRLGERVFFGAFDKLATLQSDPAFAAKVQAADDASWYRHNQKLSAISAEQSRVHDEAAALAIGAGWTAKGFDNAAATGTFVADPGQLVIGGAMGGASKILSRTSGRTAALGIADGMRAELKAGAAKTLALEETVTRLAAQGGDEAAALSEFFARDLVKAQAEQTARAASLSALDRANLEALAKLGRPSLPSRLAVQAGTSAAGAVEDAGAWLASKNQGVVDSVLTYLDAPANGATATVARVAEKVAPTSAAGAVVGAASSDDWKGGALTGAAMGAALPSTLTNAGRLTRILGENFLTGRASSPYFARLATDVEATGLERFAFRNLDKMTPAVDFARNLGGAVSKSAATGASFGFVASGGETSDLASAAGGGVAGHFAPWALIQNLRGLWSPVRSPGELERVRAGNLRVLRERWAGSDNLARLDSLSPTQQLDVAHIVSANPDVIVRLVGKDNAVIAADQLARGTAPADLSGIAGLHYKDPVTGRPVIVLNPGHPDAMAPVLAHEFWHGAQSEGLAKSIVTELIGDPDLGVPGFFTRHSENGEPVRRSDGAFAVTEDFAKAKTEYEKRAARAGFSKPLTDAEFALEHAAEQGADFILSPKFDDALRPTVGGMVASLFPQALRDAVGAAGGAFNADQSVKGSLGLLLNHSPGVEKLQAAYLKSWRVGRNDSTATKAPAVEIAREQILANPEILKVFAGSSSLNVDTKTGAIAGTRVDQVTGKLVIVDPSKVFKSAAEIAKEQTELARHVVDAVKAAKDTDTPGAVKIAVVDGKEIATGQHLSAETVAALESSGRFNPFQLDAIKNLNALTKSGAGSYVRFFYQPASVGKRYASLAGHWREEIPYGWQISAADNVLFRTVSPDKVVGNLEKLWTKDNARASTLWSSHVSMIADALKYLGNLATGVPGETGIGAARRDFLNLALGINTRGRSDINPLFSPSQTGPLTSFITSRRIDRTSRLTAPERKEGLPWSAEAYARGRENLTPGAGLPDAPDSGLPGSPKPSTSPSNGRGNESEAPREVSGKLPDTGDAVARGTEFLAALSAAAASQPAGAAVTIKPVEFYADPATKLFLAEDKTAGVAVAPDGDLVSVFKAKGSSVDINGVLSRAARVAKKLDGFASGNGYLPNLYSKHGFRPVARVAFDREFAPSSWNYERFGEPDNVFMVRDPAGVTGAPEIKGDYMAHREKVPLVSYPEALEIQERAVRTVDDLGAK